MRIAVGTALEASPNRTISLIAGLINDKDSKVSFTLTTADLSKHHGARTKVDGSELRVLLNPRQVGQYAVIAVPLSGRWADATVGGTMSPEPALVHELGHAGVFFAAFPFNVYRTRETSDRIAVPR